LDPQRKNRDNGEAIFEDIKVEYSLGIYINKINFTRNCLILFQNSHFCLFDIFPSFFENLLTFRLKMLMDHLVHPRLSLDSAILPENSDFF